MRFVYLDYNATTPLDERVLEAMMPYLKEQYGNPSSIYRFAQNARKAVEDARAKVATLLNASEREIVFTGGGTEANNYAIKGFAFANRHKGNHIITSQIEHHAVLNVCKYLEERHGFEVTYVPVDSYGVVDVDAVREAIRDDTILITIMHANNETGVLQPVEEIAKLAKERGICFHTDAIQVAGKMRVDVQALGVDLLSISAHKFYGPKGVGALFIRKGVRIDPLIHGGHQEMGKRAGTENVAGIVGLAEAFALAHEGMEEEWEREKRLRDKLERGILERIPDVIVNGHPEKRLANTLNIVVKYVEGEAMLLSMDVEGICASSGSACTSGSLEPSHVLTAMGIPHELAHGSLRFSLGRFTTEEDIDYVLDVLPKVVERLREISPYGVGKEELERAAEYSSRRRQVH
ncbi:MAG: cysteine desulfurase NifS [Armatimonadota bacterium]|nr:cysteine desulfurase NifS [Armatimonadota bacterium]MCX7777542.1 cysteine desulfurase NifS [Armatimonadota bacterium]MDW8025551.1 cysteine desulfurase NifS [Armatimonadota bacterium]